MSARRTRPVELDATRMFRQDRSHHNKSNTTHVEPLRRHIQLPLGIDPTRTKTPFGAEPMGARRAGRTSVGPRTLDLSLEGTDNSEALGRLPFLQRLCPFFIFKGFLDIKVPENKVKHLGRYLRPPYLDTHSCCSSSPSPQRGGPIRWRNGPGWVRGSPQSVRFAQSAYSEFGFQRV